MQSTKKKEKKLFTMETSSHSVRGRIQFLFYAKKGGRKSRNSLDQLLVDTPLLEADGLDLDESLRVQGRESSMDIH